MSNSPAITGAFLLVCLLAFPAREPCMGQVPENPEVLPPPILVPEDTATARISDRAPSGVPSGVVTAAGVRIKDITRLGGTRINKLTGLGLVTGLNGTGSKSPLTRQLALNLIERFDLRADPDQRAAVRLNGLDKTDNLSVVTVTAELDVMQTRAGNMVDVTVSTIDNAKSLQGGILILTPLVGLDGEVYAVASGPVSIGGFSFSGDAASVQQNHPTTGRIANGATVEKSLCAYGDEPIQSFRLHLNNPDLETASRIANAINNMWFGHSQVNDGGTVDVLVPAVYLANPLQFVAVVQALRVVPDEEARVVINERTGTVILGENVQIAGVAISHANLTVVTGEAPQVSQPAPFSDGVTAIVPRTTIDVSEQISRLTVFDRPVTVGELARALNALGVTPRDLSSIFQQLKVSGALQARLIFQ
jgi:flagellar P-ring protein FlgI